MIEKYYPNTYVPVCDCCGDELHEERDFHDAIEAMKRAGWQFVRPSTIIGPWEHYCPACATRYDFAGEE